MLVILCKTRFFSLPVSKTVDRFLAKSTVIMKSTHRYNRTYLDFLGGSAVPVLDALHAKSPAERERKIILE